MDRETGKGADTDSEAETHAGGSAAAAETQRRLPAGPRQAPARTRADLPADAQQPAPAQVQEAPAAQVRESPTEAGLPDDGSAEATTQPIAGLQETDELEGGGVQKGRLQDAGAQEARLQEARLQPPRRLVPVLRPIFPGLATDPRLPIWIARALTATAVGVAVTIWQNWRLGLTAAAAVTILDIIYRSRTTSVIPAAVRVTSAQRRTRRRLALLRGRGYIALNARAIPGSDSVIDHLVIGPPGVFALDSERWDRRLPVRTAASGRLYHGPFGQEERLEHAIWEAAQASSLLGASLGHPISVRPAMVIYGPTIPWTIARLREVDVLAGRRLRKYFRRQARQPGPRLDADQIRQIHAAAAQALPPAR